jgi:asparaginyl-tRNA synthetase
MEQASIQTIDIQTSASVAVFDQLPVPQLITIIKTELKRLPEHTGQFVSCYGFVRVMRAGKKMSFIELGYGDQQVQVVVSTALVQHLTLGSFIEVQGTVKQLPAKVYSSMPVEISADQIKVLSSAASDLPHQCPESASQEIQLSKRHFYFRDPKFCLVMRAHAQFLSSLRAYFMDSDCTEVTPPSFTGVECEGGATLFHVEHPGKSSDKPMKAFLTQSSQFALEMMLPGLGDCYCLAPSFRAEHSHTRRHLTEFTHCEAEWGGITDFADHLERLRKLMQGVIAHFLVIAKDTLVKLGKYERVQQLHAMTQDIMILEHKDAIRELTERGIYKDQEQQIPFDSRDDIPEAQERALIDAIGKIVFLVKFPKEFKSFYMGLDPADSSRVLGCDVEVPGVGEIIGSGVREADPERLCERLLDQGLKPDDYSEYLDLRKYGFAMTSGMGMGVGRFLTWLLDAHSIRDVTAFPRLPGYLRP